MLRVIALVAALMLAALPLSAQERFWVQIEAHPTIAEGQAAARAYAAELRDVAGIRLDTGWYAIALGPYSEDEARERRRALRRRGAIPRDAYVTPGERFVAQFWPGDGANVAAAPTEAEIAQALEAFESGAETPDAPTEVAKPAPPRTETPAEARRSERALDAAARAGIQRALAWEGHYEGRIDSDFGPATRRAMAAWQRAEGAEATGILTTRQRARLLEGYRGTLARLDLREIIEPEAGIRIEMPMGLIAFEVYDYPFVRYDSRDDSGVRALLISREGGRRALWGLYEVMQTLEIVPMEGARERGSRAFTLTGQNERLHSYTYATLADGAVKGFTLIWPPEEAELMNRVARRMRESFASTGRAVLAPAQAGGLPPGADLVASLEVRRPTRVQSGFYTDAAGTVVTAAGFGESCRRVTIDDGVGARVLTVDEALGLAVLAPEAALSPAGWARFAEAPPAPGGGVAVAGFSYGGQLDAPVLTFGRFAAASGLEGETTRHRLSIAARPADAGGPVLAGNGAVAGMLLPVAEGAARRLPGDVHFALPGGRITAALEAAGRPVSRADPDRGALSAEALSRRARQMTALVSCWE